jgi:cyclophilin family peptidyl-prolyl cis-trans isomerase
MKKALLLILTSVFFFAAKTTKAQTEVTFYTNYGTFVTEMYDTLQPITAGNFISLVSAKFYDYIIFHRVVAGFVIQGGDPLGTGFGGPGYTIMDEFDPAASNVQKALGMANSGPNTGGSQFFINLVNNTFLDPNYPVFGIVTSGFTVVQTIGGVPVNSADRPVIPVVMDSVRITNLFTSVDYFSGDKPLIEIYPNPVSESSVFRIKASSLHEGTVTIYSQMGIPVYQKSIPLNGSVVTLDPAEIHNLHLSAGIYHFVVSDGESVSKRKFVVLN